MHDRLVQPHVKPLRTAIRMTGSSVRAQQGSHASNFSAYSPELAKLRRRRVGVAAGGLDGCDCASRCA